MVGGQGLFNVLSGEFSLEQPTRTVDIARPPLRLSLEETTGRGYSHLQATIDVERKPDGGHHIGVDFNIGTGDEDLGEIVYLPMNGLLVYAGKSEHRDLGNIMLFRHKFLAGDTENDPPGYMFYETLFSRYSHLDELNEDLVVGETYLYGEEIGTLGKSGWPAGSTHLHLDMATKLALNALKDDPRWYPHKEDPNIVSRYWIDPIPVFKKYSDFTSCPAMPRIEKENGVSENNICYHCRPNPGPFTNWRK